MKFRKTQKRGLPLINPSSTHCANVNILPTPNSAQPVMSLGDLCQDGTWDRVLLGLARSSTKYRLLLTLAVQGQHRQHYQQSSPGLFLQKQESGTSSANVQPTSKTTQGCATLLACPAACCTLDEPGKTILGDRRAIWSKNHRICVPRFLLSVQLSPT